MSIPDGIKFSPAKNGQGGMGLANSTGMAMIAGMRPLRFAIAGCGSRDRNYARLAAHLHSLYQNFTAFAAERSRLHGERRIMLSEVRG